jgi:hypothetical protein
MLRRALGQLLLILDRAVNRAPRFDTTRLRLKDVTNSSGLVNS